MKHGMAAWRRLVPGDRAELTELADAVLCADGPVRALAARSLAPGHRRGHGALYDAVNCGRIEIARLPRSLVGLPDRRTGGLACISRARPG